MQNFYPRSPCGERLYSIDHLNADDFISIHALLAESDLRRCRRRPAARPISIHALLAESDPTGITWSTSADNFYPRSPCGERHRPRPGLAGGLAISIHALLAESDSSCFARSLIAEGFLSTLSLRRATHILRREVLLLQISIHALLAESDAAAQTRQKYRIYFYPRSPCGERPPAENAYFTAVQFLSTLSLRRATLSLIVTDKFLHRFLSTLSLRRATTRNWKIWCVNAYFYPRSPCGERRKPKRLKSRRCVFLSTLSLRRATSAR